MYSRNMNDREYKIPEHYGGTFLGGQTEGDRQRRTDAVGRPSAIPYGKKSEIKDNFQSLNMPENVKHSPLAEEKLQGANRPPEEKNEERTEKVGSSFGGDELLIAALLLILLGDGERGGDTSTLLFLILLLIF